jgi:hypothetical protein
MRPRVLLPFLRPPVVALLVAAAIVGATERATAQTLFVPYFGKNNIHYTPSSGRSTRPTTSKFTFIRKSSRTSNESPATPKAPISRSAPI